MKLEKKKNKKITVIISLILILIVGVTYSLYSYWKIGKNQLLIAGDVYLKYTEGVDTVNIEDAKPASTYGDDYFEFTVEGKNTHKKPIWYDVVIKHGDDVSDKSTRIPDKFLRFRLTEQKEGSDVEEVVKEGKYNDFSNGAIIWTNIIPEKTKTKIKITYRLYIWISNSIVIGIEDSKDSAVVDMDMDTWKDSFASVKVEVNGDFEEKTIQNLATSEIKGTLGKDGGVIGVTSTGEKVIQEDGDIREYRYSGLEVNNYVTFNNETWRIIGVFKDENGEEKVKIVKNSIEKSMAWDSIEPYSSNWLESDVYAYFNGEYYEKLQDKDMISDAKYYLGTVNYRDDASEAYKNERSNEKCDSSEECWGGEIWPGNPENWTGKIGVMYPSDYAFSVDSSFWKTDMYEYHNSAKDTSWMIGENFNHLSGEYFLSPAYKDNNTDNSRFGGPGWLDSQPTNTILGVRPVLYLKSNVTIKSGTGSSVSPYKLGSVSSELKLDDEGSYVEINKIFNLKVTSTREGIFKVLSSPSNIATASVTVIDEKSATISIKGIKEGTAKIKIIFVPSDNTNETESIEYTAKVIKNNKVSEMVKSSLGKDGGVIGITKDNKKETKTTENIREYRYSGLNVNNYIYFNCKNNEKQNTNNCELWRILGVFKAEDNVMYTKIVRNDTISGIPESYTVNEVEHNLIGGNVAYWNYENSATNYNDWTTAGLKYWLNSEGNEGGYLNSLSSFSRNMIADATYYLGNLTYNSTYDVSNTVNLSYKQERNKYSVTDGNQTTWTGKIALMYPSDYGYTADSSYWETIIGKTSFNNEAAKSSWLSTANHTINEWFLSPISGNNKYVSYWNPDGSVQLVYTNNDGRGVRPVLYLDSLTSISNGDGTKDNPYQINYNLLKLNRDKGYAEKDQSTTFKVTSFVEGKFEITSDSQEIATVSFNQEQGKEVIVTVNGVNLGKTKIRINFIPTDKKYKELTTEYQIYVTKKFQATQVKNSLGQEGGIIGISKDYEKITTKSEDIVEYRYSGQTVNNYVYFNCKDDQEVQNEENCEKWRIIGIFRDDNGNEHLKLIKNGVLLSNIMPETYKVNQKKYLILSNSDFNLAYWGWDSNENKSNNWSKAGLMYWLNSKGDDSSDPGYLKKLSTKAQNMIEESKFYIDGVEFDIATTTTTTKAYEQERSYGKEKQVTWTGKIALMYPSDYGFATESSFWKQNSLFYPDNNFSMESNWIFNDKILDDSRIWTLSYVLNNDSNSIIAINYRTGYLMSGNGDMTVLPTLYLNTEVKIVDGDGTSLQPYQLLKS